MADATSPHQPSDFPMPSGFDFGKYSIKLDTARNTATISLPVLLQSVWELQNPIDDPVKPGAKKWTASCALPKAAASKLLSELKAAGDALMAADGHKAGPYPHFVRDGGAKDANGLFVKGGGRWADFAYFSAKSKRAPTITRKDASNALIEVPVGEVQAGTYGILLLDLIVVSYGGQGSGGKRGTSAWMSRLHLAGGGKPIAGGAGQDESDFLSMIDGVGGASAAPSEAASAFF